MFRKSMSIDLFQAAAEGILGLPFRIVPTIFTHQTAMFLFGALIVQPAVNDTRNCTFSFTDIGYSDDIFGHRTMNIVFRPGDFPGDSGEDGSIRDAVEAFNSCFFHGQMKGTGMDSYITLSRALADKEFIRDAVADDEM